MNISRMSNSIELRDISDIEATFEEDDDDEEVDKFIQMTNNKNGQTEQKHIKSKGLGIRHLQSLLHFLGMAIGMALRSNFSVGIVAMTSNTTNIQFETYDWNEKIKGLLLSSFFWGYVITQFPSSILSRLFGGKIIFLVSVLGASVFSLLTPFSAYLGWPYVCGLRFVIGLFEGCIYPSLYCLMSKWIHPSERRLTTIILTGNQFGTFSMMVVCGEIASSRLGWPGIFYISGSIGVIWSAVFFWFGSDSPEHFKNMTLEEKKYLQESSGTASKDRLPIPWRQIFTSVPFYALLIVHCAANWGYFTLLTEIPTYMSDGLNFNIKSSAMLSAVPYLALIIVCLVISPLSDYLINNDYLSRVTARKLCNSLGFLAPMLCLIGLGFVTKESAVTAVILLIIGVGCMGGMNAGFNLIHMDLSPNFAPTLFGITNFFSNLLALLAPIFVGFIVTDATNTPLWRIVFFVAAAIFFIGDVIFLIFGQATLQDWNNGKITNPNRANI